jgi:hypothetical protein
MALIPLLYGGEQVIPIVLQGYSILYKTANPVFIKKKARLRTGP